MSEPEPESKAATDLAGTDSETAIRLEIPRFNWAAFLIPPIWGIANRQWWGVMFLPAWVFVDNMLRAESSLGVWTVVAGIGMAGTTVILQVFYARTADALALSKVKTIAEYERYIKHRRIWRIAAVVVFLGMVAWIATFIAMGGPVDRP